MVKIKNPIIYIALLLVIIGCSTEQERILVDTNTTIRIYSQSFENDPDNYNFNWIPPSSTQGSYQYNIKNNIMLFTPLEPGNYDIELVVTGMTNETVHEEKFLYTSVGDKIFTAIPKKHLNNVNENQKNIQPKIIEQTKSVNKKNTKIEISSDLWTVQVLSKPTYYEAEKSANDIINKGFTPWVEEFYNNKDNKTYYRVCIGSTTMQEAKKIKSDVINILNIKNPWVRKIN